MANHFQLVHVVEITMLDGPALEARDLYRFYHAGDEETLALRGVSLTVSQGEIVAITGPSGSGKSTLLACLAGLDDPDGGIVRISGELLSRQPERLRAIIRARSIGLLFQSHNLLDHLTLEANVALTQRLNKMQDKQLIETLLEELGLSNRRKAYPSQLSGGEAARAGVAISLANKPKVILADEPTGELDSQNAESVMQLLRAQARRGAAVVVVTHSESVTHIADREIRLSDGAVVTQ
jgi:putative ABC transport system ATP-binding protein